jgi:threonine/homoserine/homoserine lactone efflux protein
MFSMSQATRHGMRGAAAGTAGILFGHVLVFGAVAFGLAAVLASYSGAVTTIRIVGALYLMYLGAKMVFSRPREATSIDAPPAPPAHGGLALQGLFVQLTNPKLLLFVLALLPQFISPDYPLLLQLSIMLAVTIVIDWRGAVGLCAPRGARRSCAQGFAHIGLARTRLRRRAHFFRTEAARVAKITASRFPRRRVAAAYYGDEYPERRLRYGRGIARMESARGHRAPSPRPCDPGAHPRTDVRTRRLA